MNSKILDKRRVFETIKEQGFEWKWVRNPFYNALQARQCFERGLTYGVEEYIEKEVLVTKERKRSHIEYLKECAYCGTEAWVRRMDAKYCSGNCRKLANRERRKVGNSDKK